MTIRYVRQLDECGCALACTAMVLGLTYEEARERFGDPGNGWGPMRWEEELARAGWAWQFLWRGDQRTNQHRTPWPLAPWAELHMLGVAGGRHQVLMLGDGLILDPWDESRKTLAAYGDDISWMAALYNVRSSPGLI